MPEVGASYSRIEEWLLDATELLRENLTADLGFGVSVFWTSTCLVFIGNLAKSELIGLDQLRAAANSASHQAAAALSVLWECSSSLPSAGFIR